MLGRESMGPGPEFDMGVLFRVCTWVLGRSPLMILNLPSQEGF
jgi:hypothetical protein